MKKSWLLISVLAIIMIFALLPLNFLSADPVNLITNGDFSAMPDNLSGWMVIATAPNTATTPFQQLYLHSVASGSAIVSQSITTSQKNLTFSFDVYPEVYNAGGYVYYNVVFVKASVTLGNCSYMGSSIPALTLTKVNKNLPQWWKDTYGTDIPDYDTLNIWIEANAGCDAYFDNVRLETLEAVAPKATAEPAWVRTGPMMCSHIWINEDNKFQFVFQYPYRDNNWVRIYDMSGKMVYEVDMPYDNPNLIVDLPDGMYTVKTFTVGSAEPIQTFVIGKP